MVKTGEQRLSEWRGHSSSQKFLEGSKGRGFGDTALISGLLVLLTRNTVFCSALSDLAQIPLGEQKVRCFPVEFFKLSLFLSFTLLLLSVDRL